MADYVRVPETDWQNILDAVRGKTGSAEKMVSGVVASEIAGIQSASVSGIYMAKITHASDTGAFKVKHNLGTTDILMACCWPETLGDISPTFNGSVGSFWFKNDLPTTKTEANLTLYALYNVTQSAVLSAGIPNSAQYMCAIIDENTFRYIKETLCNI